MLTNNLFVHKKLLADFSFDEVGAKEKSIKKKSAARGGAAPPPRKLLKKLDQNFFYFEFLKGHSYARTFIPCGKF